MVRLDNSVCQMAFSLAMPTVPGSPSLLCKPSGLDGAFEVYFAYPNLKLLRWYYYYRNNGRDHSLELLSEACTIVSRGAGAGSRRMGAHQPRLYPPSVDPPLWMPTSGQIIQ